VATIPVTLACPDLPSKPCALLRLSNTDIHPTSSRGEALQICGGVLCSRPNPKEVAKKEKTRVARERRRRWRLSRKRGGERTGQAGESDIVTRVDVSNEYLTEGTLVWVAQVRRQMGVETFDRNKCLPLKQGICPDRRFSSQPSKSDTVRQCSNPNANCPTTKSPRWIGGGC
jgi:hypothetical protein